MKIALRHKATGTSKTVKVFCFALCALLFALCLPAEAQQAAKMPRIGYVSSLVVPTILGRWVKHSGKGCDSSAISRGKIF